MVLVEGVARAELPRTTDRKRTGSSPASDRCPTPSEIFGPGGVTVPGTLEACEPAVRTFAARRPGHGATLGTHGLTGSGIEEARYAEKTSRVSAEVTASEPERRAVVPLAASHVRDPFVGRRSELAETVAALEERGGRPVTLVGPGGVGKTRLAVEVASRHGDHFADGVVFVPLAGVVEPGALADAIAGSLHVGGSSAAAALDALTATLQSRKMLLILDNFEQLLEGVGVVDALVEACDDLHVLVTSRLPTGAQNERLVILDALSTTARSEFPPNAGDLGGTIGAGPISPAASLFIHRALASDPGVDLTPDALPTITEICRLVDGLPLAIELAAARVRTLALDALRDRLAAEPLDVLSGPRAPTPDRHASMQATIEWSVSLVSPASRQVLLAISVFEHDCPLDAVEAVCPEVEGSLLDALDELIDARLVTSSRRAEGGEPWFSLSAPVRDVARNKARETGLEGAARRRMTTYVRTFAGEAGAAMEGPDEVRLFDDVERMLDQLRVVMDHLGAQDPAGALRLTVDLGPFWLHRGLLSEGRRRLLEALDRMDEATTDDAVWASAWMARLSADQLVLADPARLAELIAPLDVALAHARRCGTVDDELRAINFLSHVLSIHTDDDRATRITDEGIEVSRGASRTWWLGTLLQRAAVFARMRDDAAAAVRLATEAWTIADTLDDDRLRLHAGLTVVQVPGCEQVPGAPDLHRLVEIAARVGDQRMGCMIVCSEAVERMVAGDAALAAAGFRDTLDRAQAAGYRHAIGFVLMCSAALASLVGAHEDAARFDGAVGAALPVLRRGMPPAYFALYRELVGEAERHLGDAAFDAVRSETASLGWDFATALARRFLDRVTSDDADLRGPPGAGHDRHTRGAHDLTPREVEVLQRIAEGKTNKQIAAALGITAKTVTHHTTSIYRKLDTKGRADAVTRGIGLGLIDVESEP